MKKLLAFVFVILFVFSTTCAESSTEILFRDIPWGITLDEYVRELENQGFELTEAGTNITHASLLGLEHPEYFCTAYFGSESFPGQILCQVAGHDVYGISVFSICDIVNEEINTDFLDSLVYSASYILIAFEDFDAVVNDLREKLSYLYGPESTRTSETGIISYYWKGQNETEIELSGFDFLINLVYTDKTIENHFDKLDSIIFEKTANLDGL